MVSEDFSRNYFLNLSSGKSKSVFVIIIIIIMYACVICILPIAYHLLFLFQKKRAIMNISELKAI